MSYIVGTDDLLRQLDALADLDMMDSITICTEIVRDDAKWLAPVVTGDLKESIMDDVARDGYAVDGVVYTDIDYAAAVELGIGQEAQPYLYPALNNNIAGITNVITDDLNAQIEEVAGNG